MRIISGDYGKRKLKSVPSDKTRPTSDKVKESLFNVIGPFFDGGRVLDLYAGSGSLAFEAVSRGAESAVVNDNFYPAVNTIKSNIQLLKAEDKFHVFKKDGQSLLKILANNNDSFDLVFLDPPYRFQKNQYIMEDMVKLNLLNNQALVVSETDDSAVIEVSGNFQLLGEYSYGYTVIRIYRYTIKGAN